MTEEWPATTKSQTGSDTNHPEEPHHTVIGVETSGVPTIPTSGNPNDNSGISNHLTANAAAAAATRFLPPAYGCPNDYAAAAALIPPPPVGADAAAAAAAAAVAAYPPMHHHYPMPWQNPYAPPPHMAYGAMYPPFANPYGPPHPPYPHGPPHMHPSPYNPYDPTLVAPSPYDPAPGLSLSGFQTEDNKSEELDDDEDDDVEGDELGTYGAAARMKMYVKSKVPTRQEILDRRARKNAQSRARAAKLRERIFEIKDRITDDRTDEEKAMMDQYESRRSRKNDRSRERAIEKKTEIDRILNKPERKRSKLEKQFLETALTAKQRKNEGDRLRRQRIKMMGKRVGGQDRSPMEGMSPMAPLQQFGSGFPGAYPSPRHGSATGILEAPVGNSAAAVGGVPLPFVPASQHGRSQLHLPQNSSQVEQRRHPDGSMTISIGGSRGNDEMGDMAQMLLYGENGEPDADAEDTDETEV